MQRVRCTSDDLGMLQLTATIGEAWPRVAHEVHERGGSDDEEPGERDTDPSHDAPPARRHAVPGAPARARSRIGLIVSGSVRKASCP